MSKLDEAIKSLNKKFKSDIITTDKNSATFNIKDRVPFETPALTFLFHGGFPTQTIWEVSGGFSSGKAQPLYSKVLTQDGWKPFSDIKLYDDYVYGEDGKLHQIIGIFPQGIKPIYEVTFTDGAVCRCSDEHLWTFTTPKLRENGSDFAYTKELKEIMEDFKENPKLQAKDAFPTNKTLEFSYKDVPIPPYILGLMLGDGSFTGHNIRFTNNESDVINQLIEYILDNNMDYAIRQAHGCKQINIKHGKEMQSSKQPTPIKQALMDCGLMGAPTHHKFIPYNYLFGDETQRLELLAGLINTDGHVTNHITIDSVSDQLTKDIIHLCRSLGIRVRQSTDRVKPGSHICHSLLISLDDRLYPLMSEKNKANWTGNLSRECRLRYIQSIKYIGEEECQCIYIDSPSHLYITDDYCVTHNTTLTMTIAGSFQRHYKAKWENRVNELQSNDKLNKNEQAELAELLDMGHKKVVWLDSEMSMDEDWATKNKLDLDDIIYIRPQQESAEELFDIILALIESGGVCLVVVDSIASLTSGSALQKSLTEKTYCGIAGPLTTFMSKLLPLLPKYDTTFIAINQERDVLNAMYPQKNTPGGNSFKYSCHCRISLRKGKAIDEDLKEIPNNSESYYGQMSEVQILKNKLSKPDRRLAKFTISFEDGVCPINDTFEMAVGLGIIEKAGAWFSVLDEDGNPKVDENGVTQKFQGKAKALSYYKENEEEYKRLLDLVNSEIIS